VLNVFFLLILLKWNFKLAYLFLKAGFCRVLKCNLWSLSKFEWTCRAAKNPCKALEDNSSWKYCSNSFWKHWGADELDFGVVDWKFERPRRQTKLKVEIITREGGVYWSWIDGFQSVNGSVNGEGAIGFGRAPSRSPTCRGWQGTSGMFI